MPNNPTGVWVGDYTMQPENGGLGVFAHEFGHDLGLPDLYDTSGNTGGAENNTAFWTLMSSGANIGDGGPDGIGDNPTDFGAWELFQLGWLQPQGKQGPFYDVANAGKRSSHTIGSNVPATKKAQALFTLLPDKQVPLALGAPFAGQKMYWSTQGDEIETTMTQAVPAGRTVELAAKASYKIEKDWDYAYLGLGRRRWHVDAGRDEPSRRRTPTARTRVRASPVSTPAPWTDLTGDLPGPARRCSCGSATGRTAPQTAARHQDRHRRPWAARRSVTAEAEEGWTFDGVRHGRRAPARDRQRLLQRVHRREPPVRRLRHVAEDGLQLRVPDEAGPGRELPVPERAARQLLGHLADRQQRR